MAEIKNFPNNVDEYIGAENVMKWLHGRSSGVFGADGNLSVTANGDMTVSVSDGVGWLANDKADGTVFWNDTKEQTGSELHLTIPLPDAICHVLTGSLLAGTRWIMRKNRVLKC